MKITDFMGMIGGLSLFLFGIHMLSDSLIFNKKRIDLLLLNITKNKIRAVLCGTFLTALIQSSSALSVILIGFVNAKVLPLENAIWTLMGADIGTTITGQFIALDVNYLAPFLAFIGVSCFMITKYKNISSFFIGLGLLFMGMEMMSSSLFPLSKSSLFLNILIILKNPMMAIIVGMLLTAIIQSSSASIGLLQVLALNQMIEFEIAAYLVFGMNIGTCITSTLASFHTNKNAKRLALFHFLFNVIGAFVFSGLCLLTPLLQYIDSFSYNKANSIANLHTFYNIVMVILILPIDKYLIKWIYQIIPEQKKIKIIL